MQTITQYKLSDQMEYQGTPVVNCQIRYPQFASTCSQEAARAVSGYYCTMAEGKGEYCSCSLYPEAVKSLGYSRRNKYPFYPYEFDVGYQTPYNRDCITSLYFEQYEFTGGAHGSTVRTSQTWDFETGKQLGLGDFFPGQPEYIREIQQWIEYGIEGRLKADPATYFDNYPELLRSTFRPESFYLTPKGIVLYYQQYDIAPYSTGIPEFLIPFQEMK